jgi:short subunit dehydrogenase-like uncharacterized protein
MSRVLIYGATGYTGGLAVEQAVRTGLDVVVAGRHRHRAADVGEQWGVEARAFGLDDPAAVRAAIEDVDCVLHVAGPFGVTARPMMEACIDAGVHYLDTTAEFPTFVLAESMDEAARRAGVMVLSGAGWDVVPSDCLALHTARRVTDPARLTIALRVTGGFSEGSLASAAGIGDLGVLVRAGGRIVDGEPGSLAVDFGAGPTECAPAAMGDLITGWHSTGIGDIRVYLAADFPEVTDGPGPTAEQRAASRYQAFAEVVGRDGTVARSLIDTPSGYTFTPLSGTEIARRVLDGGAEAGFRTPASAFGPELALAIGDTTITDL